MTKAAKKYLSRDDVRLRLCRLATRVARDRFDSQYASDCFCDQSGPRNPLLTGFFTGIGLGGYRFEEPVLVFIEDAVQTALKEHAMPLKRGSSQKVISQNIRELEHSQTKAGQQRTHKQNVAIALSEARKSGAKIPKRRG